MLYERKLEKQVDRKIMTDRQWIGIVLPGSAQDIENGLRDLGGLIIKRIDTGWGVIQTQEDYIRDDIYKFVLLSL